MGFVGADSGELRDLARVMQRSADRLDGDVVTAIASNLRSNPWSGPDADQFRGTWSRDSARRVHGVAASLREAAGILERNADEQDLASGVQSDVGPLVGTGHLRGGGGVGAWGDPIGDSEALQEALRRVGTSTKWMNDALATLGAKGVLSLLDALGQVGEAPNVAELIPSLSAIKGLDFFHDAIGSWKVYGGLTKGIGAVSLGVSGFETVRAFLDDSVSDGTRVGNVVKMAGKVAQRWPPTTPVYWAGTLARGGTFIVEQVAETSTSGPWPEGVSFWDGVAGKKVSRDPVVATGEVLVGAGQVLAESVTKTFGAFF